MHREMLPLRVGAGGEGPKRKNTVFASPPSWQSTTRRHLSGTDYLTNYCQVLNIHAVSREAHPTRRQVVGGAITLFCVPARKRRGGQQ